MFWNMERSITSPSPAHTAGNESLVWEPPHSHSVTGLWEPWYTLISDIVSKFGISASVNRDDSICRSILTVPWSEMGGKVQVTCPQTDYTSTLVFHTKVSGTVFLLFHLSVCRFVRLSVSICPSVRDLSAYQFVRDLLVCNYCIYL